MDADPDLLQTDRRFAAGFRGVYRYVAQNQFRAEAAHLGAEPADMQRHAADAANLAFQPLPVVGNIDQKQPDRAKRKGRRDQRPEQQMPGSPADMAVDKQNVSL